MKKIAYIVFKYLLGILLIFAGSGHFTKTEFYMKAMPDYLPFQEFLVYASGVIEILLGILLFINKTTRIAAIGIVLLLIAVFPANVHMYLNYTDFPDMTETMLLIRLPIQLVLIAWAYTYTIKKEQV